MRIFIKAVFIIAAIAIGKVGFEKFIDLPFFSLQKVKINNETVSTDDSIMKLSGLEMGKSVYRQNLDYAAEAISRQKGVVNCSVNRSFISTININLGYAEPALCLINGKMYGLSREGIVLPPEKDMSVLPLVSGKKFSKVKTYDRVKDPDISYALEMYDKMMALSPLLCARLSEINFGKSGVVKLFMAPDGTEIVMNKRSLENTLDRIAYLDKNGYLNGKKVFDLRFGSVVVQTGKGA